MLDEEDSDFVLSDEEDSDFVPGTLRPSAPAVGGGAGRAPVSAAASAYSTPTPLHSVNCS